CRNSGRGRPDCALVLGRPFTLADDSAAPVPLQQFQRSQSAHSLSVCRVEWRSFLFSAKSDTSAGLFADGSRGRAAAVYLPDVLVIALVRGACRSIWRPNSVSGRPPERSRRLRAL